MYSIGLINLQLFSTEKIDVNYSNKEKRGKKRNENWNMTSNFKFYAINVKQ